MNKKLSFMDMSQLVDWFTKALILRAVGAFIQEEAISYDAFSGVMDYVDVQRMPATIDILTVSFNEGIENHDGKDNLTRFYDLMKYQASSDCGECNPLSRPFINSVIKDMFEHSI